MPIWEDKAIYVIPAGQEFSLSNDDAVFAVYSPLANKAFLVTRDEAENVCASLRELIQNDGGQRDETLLALFAEERRERMLGVQIEPEDCVNLTILPNNRCNFNCSYCYSAGGRSKEELSVDQILTLAKWVHKNASERHQDCRILFLGGGEPLMSWDTVKKSIEEIETLKGSGGSNVVVSISTNGSLLTREKIEFFIQHHVNVQVSFEILEEVQNGQRGHFDMVHQNILLALDMGLQVSIHSVVTNANVARMEEAVKMAHKCYGHVKKIGFEPVVDPDLKPHEAGVFFDSFFRNFVLAERYAESQGIQLLHSASKNLEQLRTHYCASQLTLTPHGSFSSCEAISSPKEKYYDEFIFGRIGEGDQVYIDAEAFRRFHPKHPSFLKTECASCWARWNCGGGCNYKRYEYTQEVFSEYCKLFRRLILHSLANRLRREYAKHSPDMSLDQAILNHYNS